MPEATTMTELRTTDPTTWATSPMWVATELKDVRDLKEVQFLSKVISEMNAGRYAQLMDMVVMRIREAHAAKKEGGSWEKAPTLSMLTQGAGPQASLPEGP
eukprot:4622220-Amphidinium_carterae.1